MKITKFTTTQCIIALALFCGFIMCCSCNRHDTQKDLMLNAYKTRVQQLEQNNELLLDYYKATNDLMDSIDKDRPIEDTYFEMDCGARWLDLNADIGLVSLKERGWRWMPPSCY